MFLGKWISFSGNSCKANCTVSVLTMTYVYPCSEITYLCIQEPEIIIKDALANIEKAEELLEKQTSYKNVGEAALSLVESVQSQLDDVETRENANQKNDEVADCKALDFNYIQLLDLLTVISDTNIDMIKKYEAVLVDVLGILDDICSKEELKAIKYKADQKIATVNSQIAVYLKVKNAEITKHQNVIDDALKDIDEANDKLESDGKPTIPPPAKYIPDKIIAEAIDNINMFDEELKMIEENRKKLESLSCFLIEQQTLFENIETDTKQSSNSACSEFMEFLNMLSDLNDENIENIGMDTDSFKAAACSSDEVIEIIPQITIAKNAIVVYIHEKIKITENLLEDIQEALEKIDEANNYLESENKPTIPTPDIDYSLSSPTSSSPGSSASPTSGFNDIAVVISS